MPRENHTGICSGHTGLYNSFHDRWQRIFKCVSVRYPVGNSYLPHKRDMVLFFDVLTGVAQMMIFFLLGLLVTPSELPQVILPSLVIMIFLTFVGRPVSVAALLAGFGHQSGRSVWYHGPGCVALPPLYLLSM